MQKIWWLINSGHGQCWYIGSQKHSRRQCCAHCIRPHLGIDQFYSWIYCLCSLQRCKVTWGQSHLDKLFLSSHFLISCYLRQLHARYCIRSILHTVTSRMQQHIQQEASTLPVPQRWQRTGVRDDTNIFFFQVGSINQWNSQRRENAQDIFKLLRDLPFLHIISAIFHDTGMSVITFPRHAVKSVWRQ